MTRPILILRPEPAAQDSLRRCHAAGLEAHICSLFALTPRAWDVPDKAEIDALMLTSSNAVRLAGPALEEWKHLPTYCVGPATAAAAQAAGLHVLATGEAGAQALLEDAAAALPPQSPQRWLWLAGAERTALRCPLAITLDGVTVYGADPLPIDPMRLAGPAIALVHSSAAARRLAALAPDRAALSIIAISAATADAAGLGWAGIHVAATPQDSAMVAIAANLCQKPDLHGHT